MGEKKTPKPFIASCNQFKYLDVLAEAETNSLVLDNNHKRSENNKDKKQNGGKGIEADGDTADRQAKNISTADTVDNGKNMTDIEVIKAAVLKMMNEVDEEDQSMNMGELGSRLVKRYPDFDVRNYGDTKLSKFLKKFDFLEINSKGKGGSSMWVSLRAESSSQPEEKKSNPQPRKRRTNRKKSG